ncbi:MULTISPECIES: dihydroorotase [Oscillospiraceae]|uniref:dihydroorotase n=1 Tax=Oscillospiraceae TaxID=216572 RepID=UPI00110627CB|nr:MULTISPECIES: dihydroorotase [Oscillospiraceae]
MKTWIQNGHVLDPLTGTDQVCDVLVDGERIKKVGTREEIQRCLESEDVQMLDASGCYVMPGFIDLHVHFRDPGLTYKETLKTGGEAAARGGVTTVCAMPNTKPVIDTKEKVEEVHRRAKEESPVNIIQLGAITAGEEGKELADIKGMAEAGCMALSEDGKSVMNSALYREGMKLAKKYGLLIFAHCEEIDLRRDPDTGEDGVMNKCQRSEELSLPGITNSVEDIITARDIFLAKETGVHLHLCHCSTKGTVDLMRMAKAEGISVSAEVCPHHFTLSTDDITEDHGRFKMNPPLREMEDVEALRQGLKEGVMEAISTDHAPHSVEEKDVPMRKAAFGIVGLETSAALTYTELVEGGVLTPMQMAERMSFAPAKILGLKDKGSVSEGKIADLVVFDPSREYEIDTDTFFSKGKNTPFDGWKVKGDVKYTLVDGNVVYKNQAYEEQE